MEGAAFGVFLVSTPAAIAPAYGERNAARFSTIEAGHIAQLLLTGAPERGLGLCAVGEMDFDAVRADFGVDDDQELLLSLWGGALTPDARARREALRTGTATGTDAGTGTDVRTGDDAGGVAVAVVGFAAELPGARSLHDLDALLARGGTATGPVPEDRWAPLRSRARRAGAGVGGYLDDVLAAEAEEFGIDPAEGPAVDPQERLLLSVARRCFEDAAVVPARLAEQGPVGVFVGSMWHDHALHGVAARAGGRPDEGTHATRGGLAHRTSHAFGLTGPSVLLDTGCVSGLAAVEAAYRAVADGRCTAALAAAANLVLHPDHLDVLSEMGLVAEDADSCAFTDRASGWLVGEGVGAVLLKPLERALADGDPVHAVLRGGALQHSGTTRQFGVPDPQRQEQTMRAALADARLAPPTSATWRPPRRAPPSPTPSSSRPSAGCSPTTRPTPRGGGGQGAGGNREAEHRAPGGRVGLRPTGQGHRAVPPRRAVSDGPVRRREPRRRPRLGPVALAGRDVGHWRTAPGRPRRVLVNGFAGGGSYGSLVVEEPPAVTPAAPVAPDDEVRALPLSADTPENLAALAESLADAWERDPGLSVGRWPAPCARAVRTAWPVPSWSPDARRRSPGCARWPGASAGRARASPNSGAPRRGRNWRRPGPGSPASRSPGPPWPPLGPPCRPPR